MQFVICESQECGWLTFLHVLILSYFRLEKDHHEDSQRQQCPATWRAYTARQSGAEQVQSLESTSVDKLVKGAK